MPLLQNVSLFSPSPCYGDYHTQSGGCLCGHYLTPTLFCNLLHFGGGGRRSEMTHWRAGFEGKRLAHRPIVKISTRWWVNRAAEPPIRRGSKCFQITSAHMAGNVSSDAAASFSSSHCRIQVTRWRVNFGADDPSTSHSSKYRPSDGSIRRPNPYPTPAPGVSREWKPL